jgi:hypothetical protein
LRNEIQHNIQSSKFQKICNVFNTPLNPLLRADKGRFFINPSKIRAFKLRRSVMFVEKQPTKTLSSVGAICKNGLNTYIHISLLWSFRFFAFLYYKHLTPTGSKTSYFLCFTKKTYPYQPHERGSGGVSYY